MTVVMPITAKFNGRKRTGSLNVFARVALLTSPQERQRVKNEYPFLNPEVDVPSLEQVLVVNTGKTGAHDLDKNQRNCLVEHKIKR